MKHPLQRHQQVLLDVEHAVEGLLDGAGGREPVPGRRGHGPQHGRDPPPGPVVEVVPALQVLDLQPPEQPIRHLQHAAVAPLDSALLP